MMDARNTLSIEAVLKVKGWKNKYHKKTKHKKAGMAITISDKTDFRRRNITEKKEEIL